MPLSDTACRNLKATDRPLKRSDGGGLFLLVTPTGGKLWRLSYRFDGKQKTLALGQYPAISLADARRARDDAKEQLAAGIDPALKKKTEKRARRIGATNTFESIAREWHVNRSAAWTPGTAGYVLKRLEADLFPDLGSRPIAEIDAPELLEVMRKIERRGVNEIARRLLATCSQIFRYAIVTRRGVRDPAADLRGALKARPRQQHHRAMSREDLPGFLRALSSYEGERRTALALRLAALTFVRTSELRAARWSEFENLDAETPLWRISPDRMKMRAEHIVPLAPPAVTILQELKLLSGNSPFVFPSAGKERCMSNNTMLYAMYRMGEEAADDSGFEDEGPLDEASARKKDKPYRTGIKDIDRMNRRHATAWIAGKSVLLTFDPKRPNQIDFGPVNGLHDFYANYLVPGDKGVLVPISKFWLGHPKRRTYDEGIHFTPGQEKPKALNLWRGWAVEPNPTGSCQLFLDHIKNVVARGNEEHYRYIIGWMAHLIQQPLVRPGVALVLRGEEGVGKDTLGKYLGKLFPDNHVPITSLDDLLGRFNSSHERALLLHVEEAFWAGDKNHEGPIRGLVTADHVFIERKGIDKIKMPTYSRIFITSNADWVVKASECFYTSDANLSLM